MSSYARQNSLPPGGRSPPERSGLGGVVETGETQAASDDDEEKGRKGRGTQKEPLLPRGGGN